MGRKTTRASPPRLLIRSLRFRTWSRRFLRWRWRRFLMWWRRFLWWWRQFLRWRWRRFLMWWRRFLWWWRRFPMWSGQFLTVSALVQDMLTSVAGAVVPLTQLQSDLYSFLFGIAGVTPVSDVIALVQDMLSSVAGAVVLLAQLPSDLYYVLLGIAEVQPVVGGLGGIHGRGLSAAAGASVASQLPLGPPLAGISGPPVTGEATGVAPLDVIALGQASAVSGMAPLAADAAFPIGAESFRHVFGEILLPVSLWALAAGALPGAGGLGFITLAGVRVGYRQVKAGVALRTTGIAHFARLGPLGIVRPMALRVVRPRALRVVRPGPLSAEHLLRVA